MQKRIALAGVALLATVGCTATFQDPEPAIDREAERAALLERDRAQAQAYATSETPLDTIFEGFAEDARVLAPGMPMVEGWEASHAAFAELEKLPGYSLEYTPVLAEVGGAADLGYTIGTYRMTLPDGDGNLNRHEGKYMTVWKRQPNGEWQVAVDMFNENGPPVPATE